MGVSQAVEAASKQIVSEPEKAGIGYVLDLESKARVGFKS